jgi:hypothetical protein
VVDEHRLALDLDDDASSARHARRRGRAVASVVSFEREIALELAGEVRILRTET